MILILLKAFGIGFLIAGIPIGFIMSQFVIHETDEKYYEEHPDERPNYPW